MCLIVSLVGNSCGTLLDDNSQNLVKFAALVYMFVVVQHLFLHQLSRLIVSIPCSISLL